MNGHDFTREQNMEARIRLAAARRELAKALAAYAKAAREARRLTYELWASETEWFEGCKRQAADEQGIDLEYDPEPDPDPKLALFWELLEEFADCEDTLLESAETADTIIRLIAGGNAGSPTGSACSTGRNGIRGSSRCAPSSPTRPAHWNGRDANCGR